MGNDKKDEKETEEKDALRERTIAGIKAHTIAGIKEYEVPPGRSPEPFPYFRSFPPLRQLVPQTHGGV